MEPILKRVCLSAATTAKTNPHTISAQSHRGFMRGIRHTRHEMYARRVQNVSRATYFQTGATSRAVAALIAERPTLRYAKMPSEVSRIIKLSLRASLPRKPSRNDRFNAVGSFTLAFVASFRSWANGERTLWERKIRMTNDQSRKERNCWGRIKDVDVQCWSLTKTNDQWLITGWH